MIICKFKPITDSAKIPTKAYVTDAGMDFYADESVTILPQTKAIVSTGLILEMVWDTQEDSNIKTFIENNFIPYLKITSKSGISAKYNIETGAGVIDLDYRGEIKIILYNHSKKNKYVIPKGNKIAQGIVYVLPKINIIETNTILNTVRGENGFGSTGGY